MHLQIKEPVMKKETKKTRERKHPDGVANQLRNRAPKKGDIILNFEEATGSDLTDAMDEAKTQSVKEEVKIFAQQVREGLAKGDTLETIKYRLSNDYPSWPIEQIEAFVAKIQKIEAKKSKSEPAPTEEPKSEPAPTEIKPVKTPVSLASLEHPPKAEKPSPEESKEAADKIATQHEKLLADLTTATAPGVAPTAPLKLAPEVIALAKAVKVFSGDRTNLPFNSNRVDHYLWIAGLVKKHGDDVVTAAVQQVHEKNGGIHLRVNQKLLVKP